MTPLISVIIIAAIPIVLAIVLRVNAVFLFLSLMVGELMVTYLSNDAVTVAGSFSKGAQQDKLVPIILLWLPIALTLLFLRKSLPTSKLPLHIVPIIATGLAGAVLTLNLLSSSFQNGVYASQYGSTFKQIQDFIVVGAGILILLLVWATYRRPHHSEHGKHH